MTQKADDRQIQMRILANLSEDPELVRAFREGNDVHWLTVEMCGIQGATDTEKRDKAKAVNFAILFQMTADGLSSELGTDRKTAQRFIDAFWDKYSTAKKWLDDFVGELKDKPSDDRVVRSSLGRTRRFEGEFGQRERRRAKAIRSIPQRCGNAEPLEQPIDMGGVSVVLLNEALKKHVQELPPLESEGLEAAATAGFIRPGGSSRRSSHLQVVEPSLTGSFLDAVQIRLPLPG